MVGGGVDAASTVPIARSMGLEPIVLDANPHCAASEVGAVVLKADIFNLQQCVAALKIAGEGENSLAGVISVGADCAFTAAGIAHHFGLLGIPLEAGLASSNKILMKKYFSRSMLKFPAWRLIQEPGDIPSALAQLGSPAVLKPVDSRGSRGVFLVRSEQEARHLLSSALAESNLGVAILESYLEGPQFSTETLLISGEAHTIGISTRNYLPLELTEPFFVEDGGELPPDRVSSLREMVDSDVTALATVAGISEGSVKGDLVMCGGQMHWIEATFRVSGGFFATHEIPLSTGVDFVGNIVRLSVGQQAELPIRTRERPIVQRYLWARNDTVWNVVMPADLERNLPGWIEIWAPREQTPGRQVTENQIGFSKVGVVMVSGDSLEDARNLSAEVVAEIIASSDGLVDLPSVLQREHLGK